MAQHFDSLIDLFSIWFSIPCRSQSHSQYARAISLCSNCWPVFMIVVIPGICIFDQNRCRKSCKIWRVQGLFWNAHEATALNGTRWASESMNKIWVSLRASARQIERLPTERYVSFCRWAHDAVNCEYVFRRLLIVDCGCFMFTMCNFRPEHINMMALCNGNSRFWPIDVASMKCASPAFRDVSLCFMNK